MEITIPAAKRERYFTALAKVGSHQLQIWGQNRQETPLGDPRIVGTTFSDDPPAIREVLNSRILAGAETESGNLHGNGGKKIRNLQVWDSPEGKLLTLRALMFACKHYGIERAYTADRWANVIEKSDYSCPHSHYDSKAAVVYFSDLGEPSPSHPYSGRFELLDPRIPFCCSKRSDAPTRGLLPDVVEGTMILFPSELIHYVHPYMGDRPRITLAWNIAEGREPEDNPSKLTQQVEGSFGAFDPTRP